MTYQYSVGAAKSFDTEIEQIKPSIKPNRHILKDHKGLVRLIWIITGVFLVGCFLLNIVFPSVIRGSADPHLGIITEINDRGAAQSNCEMPDDVIGTAFKTQKSAVTSFYIGAICRWLVDRGWEEIEVSYSWFERGTLDREKQVNKDLGFTLIETQFQSMKALLVRLSDGCGFVTNNPNRVNGGIVQFWVQVSGYGNVREDFCPVTQDLMHFAFGDSA